MRQLAEFTLKNRHCLRMFEHLAHLYLSIFQIHIAKPPVLKSFLPYSILIICDNPPFDNSFNKFMKE